ncbi:DegT/DnrJ/EryC1/StrS family aminotransferase [Halorubellus sp. PRR65]|uniref:DegT/DnrJ/EryC1/StrS family aminotransferase n=1 Tax=Halorubellus sp. PRR65 TaxID=3098148 RepID=UPI002B261A75|nr:DegT/DnrJ/EryC1/StrS family aminotransferase [Halorubellus sp. PRR65]
MRTDTAREASARDHGERGTGPQPAKRPFHELPGALTRVTAGDIAAGLGAHALGRGRAGFVDDVRAYLDADSAATYSSYRRALGAALRALDEATDGSRRTVLLPAFCSSDFLDAVDGVGLDARRYDVDPETLAADERSLRDATGEDVVAVVAVNVLGYGSDVSAMRAIADDADCFLLEALGYALGASYDDRRLGTYGDVSVLNFQQGKPIPVGGGMAIGRHPDVTFSDVGREPAPPNVAALAGYALVQGPRRYYAYSRVAAEFDRNTDGKHQMTTHPDAKDDIAYDADTTFATMSNFQCAVARRVFARTRRERRARARTAAAYATAFSDLPHVRVIRPLRGISDHQWVRFGLLVDSYERRNEIAFTLDAHGVGTSRLYDWPKIDGDAFPGARALQRRILPLPTHHLVDDADRERVVDLVANVCRAYDDRLD